MIIGAGLSGLIAAHAFPMMPIFECAKEPFAMHKALLRFRTEKVSRLTGIPFKQVTVRKGIHLDGEFQSPTIRNANLYSVKVAGCFVDRSIWNLDAATRYIAPDDFYERLVEQASSRIKWDFKFDFSSKAKESVLINTTPLPTVLKASGIDYTFEFKRSPIWVLRAKLVRTDVYQTIYFPTPLHNLYRASITGDTAIFEFTGEPDGDWQTCVAAAFGFSVADVVDDAAIVQRQDYGKIVDIDKSLRKAALATLTNQHNIFSLGRFATWRNILLDDVVDDAAVVKRLISMSSYERKLLASS